MADQRLVFGQNIRLRPRAGKALTRKTGNQLLTKVQGTRAASELTSYVPATGRRNRAGDAVRPLRGKNRMGN